MLDTEFIRKHRTEVEDSAKKKGVEVDISKLLELDEERRDLITKNEELRRERNELTQDLKSQPSSEQIEKGKKLKEEIAKVEAKLNEVEPKYRELALNVPNLLHDSVPAGKDEEDNEVVKTVGQKPEQDFEVKDHLTLGVERDLIDTETAAQVSGSRFYYLKNDAVLLEFALVNWVLKKLNEKGFTPVTTPTLVREKMMEVTGFFPAERNEIYQVNPDDDNLFLVGTAEVALAGLHMKEPLDEDELNKRYIGFSTSYRREAGSYGKDTHGILRVHQFDKLEMYSFAHPDKSWEEHEYLFSVEEEILGDLGLHYQVVNVCAGDLGVPAAKKYDCEAWVPSQGKFREVTSCSNTTDFQARRGGMKYKTKDGNLQYVHTLNGTAIAVTRILVAIFEQFQTAEGKIRIPTVLQPYMGGKEII